jgi:hypothetical protein
LGLAVNKGETLVDSRISHISPWLFRICLKKENGTLAMLSPLRLVAHSLPPASASLTLNPTSLAALRF